MIPEPFVGAVKTAPVVVLQLNPGFGPKDAASHADPEFRTRLVQNARTPNGSAGYTFPGSTPTSKIGKPHEYFDLTSTSSTITTRGIIKARRICCCSQPATSYLSPSARCAPVNGLAGCYVSTIGKPHEYFDLTGKSRCCRD